MEANISESHQNSEIYSIIQSDKENIKPAKRVGNPKNHRHVINKMKREKGEEYKTRSGKIVPEKCFQKIICKCRKSCHLTINEQQQKEIFQNYYSLNSWTAKTTFLFNNIGSVECKKRRKPSMRKNIQFKKSFTRSYYFLDKKNIVCKSFFKRVLQISERRIEQCVAKRQNSSSSCASDLRGKHSHHKKTPAARILHAVQIIASLPKYESHYAREHTQSNYLGPNLNMKILYNEYRISGLI